MEKNSKPFLERRLGTAYPFVKFLDHTQRREPQSVLLYGRVIVSSQTFQLTTDGHLWHVWYSKYVSMCVCTLYQLLGKNTPRSIRYGKSLLAGWYGDRIPLEARFSTTVLTDTGAQKQHPVKWGMLSFVGYNGWGIFHSISSLKPNNNSYSSPYLINRLPHSYDAP
jgi:hypothetical protein